MLRAFLFPILLSVSCLLLQFVSSRSRGENLSDNPEFRFSKGLRAFLWIVTFGQPTALIALTWSDGPVSTPHWIILGVFFCYLCGCCIYADRYVLTLWNDHLSYGAFKTSSIDYKDITSAEVSVDSSGKRTLVIKTLTNRMAISGYLGSLDDAARLLKDKLSSRPRIL